MSEEYWKQREEEEEKLLNWYDNEASEKEQELYDKMLAFGKDYFQDMIFADGSPAFELTLVEYGDGQTVGDTLPEILDPFSYDAYRVKVETLGEDTEGQFNPGEKTITLIPEKVDDDATLFHEMIHLHEELINTLPMYYHDMLLWSLYADLKNKIEDLDKVITDHAYLLSGNTIYESGGTHDILFLLKSLDLDIRKGYPLGTVFAYGRQDLFKDLKKLS